ncbi:MAG: iron chelate uptake ABC transporter family permease subunit [Candidatus Sumerlaeaceae bacterium]
MSDQLTIQVIAAVTAIACALPGVFLLLRRMSLMSDAISHVVLLGIAIGFLLTHDLASPLLVIGAAITGVITVSLVELLSRTQLVKRDAAIGLVFPALFSAGVILISRNAGDVHLDIDAVLLGELAFAPYNRFAPGGHDLGPQALWLMCGILLLNVLFIALFYKELKLVTFDSGLAAALGFLPGPLNYALMTLVSVTAVGAFDSVGSILVVALMIAPAATAYLLTDRLSRMLLLSGFIGVVGAITGYWFAHLLDASIAGCIATMLGVLFAMAFTFAPNRGLVAIARRKSTQRTQFAQKMLTIHLLHHEGKPEAAEENRLEHLPLHLRWSPGFAAGIVRLAEREGLIRQEPDGTLVLTDGGRQNAAVAMVA